MLTVLTAFCQAFCMTGGWHCSKTPGTAVPATQVAKNAVEDFRAVHNITDELQTIDNTGVYWRKARHTVVNMSHYHAMYHAMKG
jgi:hypothetical protein